VKTYSGYIQDIPRIINNSSADNLLWGTEVLMDSLRYLITKYYFNERSYSVPGGSIAQTQFYNLPPQVKKLINVTVQIGTLIYQPTECPSRSTWDYLNTIPVYQDYPARFFVWNGQVGLFPIPASSGNAITLNYKTRIVDLSQADVTNVTATTTVSVTTNTTTVTAAGNAFQSWMAGQWIRIPFSNTTTATNGDNQWYQIASVTSATVLVLMNNYSGTTVSGGNFTIGQVSILPEDYQDLPLYRMGVIYYTTRFPDPTKAQLYQKLWDAGEAALDDEFGSKTSSIILPDQEVNMINPNLLVQKVT
jgi:hypothetical protein